MLALLLASVAAGPPPAVPQTRPANTTVRQAPPPTVGVPPGLPLVVGPGVPAGPPPGNPAVRADPLPPGSPPLKFQQACPGEVPQPFQRQPRVTPVGPCQTDGTLSAGASAGRRWAVEFDEPAHFPIPRFDQDRKAVCDTDGLVIYEGMRLSVDDITGTFDLEFTATVPGCLTVLRLQLLLDWQSVRQTKVGEPAPADFSRYTLTLPPIRLDPADAGRGNTDGDTFHVHHRGYSSRFLGRQATAPDDPMVRQGWTVRRAGTARFGTPVAVDETGR